MLVVAQRCTLARMITALRAGVSVTGTVSATIATGIVTEIETGSGNGTMRKKKKIEMKGMVQSGLETGAAQSAITTVFSWKTQCPHCGTAKDGSAPPEGFKPGDRNKGKGKGEEDLHVAPAPEKYAEDLWEAPREIVGLSLISEDCPRVNNWRYVLRDDSRRCFAGLHPSPFSEEQLSKLFEDVRDGTSWKQPEGPNGLIPRKTAWMVAAGCGCTYRYGRIEVDPQPYPPWMHDVMKQVMPYCGIELREDWPTSCNLNLYEDGGMSVGWHSDDERLFQGKFQDIRILSFSLGVSRKFELRANWPEENEKQHRRVLLSSGDIMTMEGMLQKHYQHRVPREENIQRPRINLTWRWIFKHTPRCPAGRRRPGNFCRSPSR